MNKELTALDATYQRIFDDLLTEQAEAKQLLKEMRKVESVLSDIALSGDRFAQEAAAIALIAYTPRCGHIITIIEGLDEEIEECLANWKAEEA